MKNESKKNSARTGIVVRTGIKSGERLFVVNSYGETEVWEVCGEGQLPGK